MEHAVVMPSPTPRPSNRALDETARAARVRLLAGVAARAGRDEELAVRAEPDGAGVVAAPARQLGDDRLGTAEARAVRADPEADDAVGFADVEVVVVEGETVGLAQAVGPDLDLVCDTVTVMDEGRLPYSPFAV
jgi:hypothetical protein